MAKTSLTAAIIAGIVAATFLVVIINGIALLGQNYDISGFDNSSLSAFGNSSDIIGDSISLQDNVTSQINADSSLFDVLGGLVVKGIGVVKQYISTINFVADASNAALGSDSFYVDPDIVIAVILIIGLIITSYLLFKIIMGRDDER